MINTKSERHNGPLVISKTVLLLFLLLPLSAFSATQLPRGFYEELLVYGLRQPVAAEYAPDGRLFILEKQGRVRILKNGKLLTKAFLKLSVNTLYERGLLGIAFDPDFSRNHYVYIYRTTSGSAPENRVERYTAAGDVGLPSSRVVLVSGIRSDAGIHNAGCLRFGPDGKLYISTGDGGQDSQLAQDLGSLNGKILRINSDGTIPSDNPFVSRAGARAEVWCYGLRNPWRFSINPKTGQLVIGDVGGDSYEEVNLGQAGGNYGWPLAEGPSSDPEFINPVYYYNHDAGGAAITIGTFYTGGKYPATFRGRLFFTDYGRSFIKTMRLNEGGQVISVRPFAENLITPVHVLQDPEGSILYVTLTAGEIRRIRYVGGRNRPPVAEASARNRSGLAPLQVNFSGRGSFDPDRNPITYHWDFGDGTSSTEKSPSHVYSKNGTYFALLKVRDSKGAVGDSRSIRIVVGNRPPVATILTPANGTSVRLGQVVQFTGKATDPEDGTVAPEDMFWSAKLHHDNHTHPVLGGVRGTSGSFPIPSSLHATGTLFFRLRLRVMDSGRLVDIAYIDLPLEQ